MKTIISIALIAATMIFTGCTDGGGSFETQNKELSLIIGEEISIKEGDKLQADEETIINVIHEVDTTTKKLTLLSGRATLIRGDYVLVD